jgi:hypothetical protein
MQPLMKNSSTLLTTSETTDDGIAELDLSLAINDAADKFICDYSDESSYMLLLLAMPEVQPSALANSSDKFCTAHLP